MASSSNNTSLLPRQGSAASADTGASAGPLSPRSLDSGSTHSVTHDDSQQPMPSVRRTWMPRPVISQLTLAVPRHWRQAIQGRLVLSEPVQGGITLMQRAAILLYARSLYAAYLEGLCPAVVRAPFDYVADMAGPLAVGERIVQFGGRVADTTLPLWSRYFYRAPVKLSDAAAVLWGVLHGVSWQRLAWLAKSYPGQPKPEECVAPRPMQQPAYCPDMLMVDLSNRMTPAFDLPHYIIWGILLGAATGCVVAHVPPEARGHIGAARQKITRWLDEHIVNWVAKPLEQLLKVPAPVAPTPEIVPDAESPIAASESL